jgi:DNA-binding transcriptional LysR family regulator
MQYNNIRSFHWTAHLGSILAASKHLNVAPSAISLQISQLEERYGIKLFQRTGNSLKLTKFGLSLKKETDGFFESFQKVNGILDKTKNRGSLVLNIGTESHKYILDLLRLKNNFSDNYSMRFFDFQRSRLIKMFTEHKIDILIANSTKQDVYEPKDIVKYWLGSCRLCLIAHYKLYNSEKPLATTSDLIDFLQNTPVISRVQGSFTRSLQEQIYNRLGMEENTSSEISHSETFVRLIHEMAGVGFIVCDGTMAVNEELRYISIPDDESIADLLEIDQFLYYAPDLERHEIIKSLKSLRTDDPHPVLACG